MGPATASGVAHSPTDLSKSTTALRQVSSRPTRMSRIICDTSPPRAVSGTITAEEAGSRGQSASGASKDRTGQDMTAAGSSPGAGGIVFALP